MSIISTNKKIVEFYSKNPHLDFDKVNLAFISIIEQLSSDLFKTAEASMSLEYLKDIITKVEKIDMKNDMIFQQGSNILAIVQSLQTSLNTHKEMYVTELKSIFEYNNTINHSKMQDTLDKYISMITNQVKIILSENIPKTNEELYTKLTLYTTKHFNELEKSLYKLTQTDTLENSIIKEIQDTIDNSYGKVISEIDANVYKYVNNSHTSIVTEFVKQKEIYENMSEFLKKQKYNISLNIGKEGENKLENVLNELFPSSMIRNTSRQDKSADFILERSDKEYTILFENKEYTKNVDVAEVNKFIRDIENVNTHGIFLSQTSGISGKQAFEINLHNNCILIFIHNVNYDKRIILSAVNTIDMLVKYIKTDVEIDDDDKHTITVDTLEAINNEYTNFIKKRNAIIDTLKRNYKDVMSKVEDIDMRELHMILKSKFSSTEQVGFVCQHCGSSFMNKRALGSHYKGCKLNSSFKKSIDTEHENKIVSVIDMSH
jgi:hypothetical protein